jgi:glycosyltransferase involved in cell wall biosynthesis
LAEKIINILNDSALARKLGQNARETVVERFTFQKFADGTKEAYNHVMSS